MIVTAASSYAYCSSCADEAMVKDVKIRYFFRACKGSVRTYIIIAGFDQDKINFLTVNSGENTSQPKCPAVMDGGEAYVVKAEIFGENITSSKGWWVLHNDVVMAKGKIALSKLEFMEHLNNDTPENLIKKLKGDGGAGSNSKN